MTRCGTIALVGQPNAGKSTLLNAVVGQHLAIVSPKPQSTRLPVTGVRTDGDTQLVFVDCPGLLEPDYLLQGAMHAAAVEAIHDADLIAYLHPLADFPAPDLASLARLDRPPRAPVVTVYTKADLVGPSAHPLIRPSDALVLSATTGDGVDAFLARCRDHAPESPFHYPADEISTQPLRFFVAEYLREAAFDLLEEELPYALACEVDEFREAETPVYIRTTLFVERDSQKGMVVGAGGRTIKAIGTRARQAAEALVGRPVYLDLWVKVLPKWRSRREALTRLGFRSVPKEITA
jgi:GTPase